jgi:hypothetical protein
MTKPFALTLFSLLAVAIVVWAQPFQTDNTATLAQVEQADRQFLETLEQQQPAIATVRPVATEPATPAPANVQPASAPNPMPVAIEPTPSTSAPAPAPVPRTGPLPATEQHTRVAVRSAAVTTATEPLARVSKRPPAPVATGPATNETAPPKTARSDSKATSKTAVSQRKATKRPTARPSEEWGEPMVRRAIPVVRETVVVREEPEARPLKRFRLPAAESRPRISIFNDRNEPEDDD